MKIRIEQVHTPKEEEVVIRCMREDERVQGIRQAILDQLTGGQQPLFFKGEREYYFPLSNVLFFQTEGDSVYAHTATDSFQTNRRLYELEEMLPRAFLRVSKSTILNAGQVYAVEKNLASSSRVEFGGTHKVIYVSRRYYSQLKQRLQERKEV